MIQIDTKRSEDMVKTYINSDREDHIRVEGETFTISAWLSRNSNEWKCFTCNTGSEEFEEFVTKELHSTEDLVLLCSLVDMKIEDIQQFYEELYKTVQQEPVPYDDCYGVKVYKLFSVGDLVRLTFLLIKQYLSTVRCSWCGKEFSKYDLVLKHEYGSYYCSYKCLCEGGFYGHWSRTSTEKALEETKQNIL